MEFFEQPIFFERNRVFRVYKGGALFADFFGDKREDGFYPEEWVASDVRALNEGHDDIHEGISKIAGTDIYLNDALRDYAPQILGSKTCLGVLTKILDSAIRLPVQAHPSKEFALEHFSSRFGKQEAWLILGKREGAGIYYGFKDGVTMDDFKAAIEKSETDSEAMKDLLVYYDVTPGDVIFIPAGMVHAIGSGCLLLEAQEPTDFTIQPERYCGEYRLSDNEMYLGLEKEAALGCFEMDKRYELPLKPMLLSEENGAKYEELIGRKQTDCFGMRRITLENGSFVPRQTAGVYVVTDGEGEITAQGYSKKLTKGDYFLLPHLAVDKFTLSGNMTVAESFGL